MSQRHAFDNFGLEILSNATRLPIFQVDNDLRALSQTHSFTKRRIITLDSFIGTMIRFTLLLLVLVLVTTTTTVEARRKRSHETLEKELEVLEADAWEPDPWGHKESTEYPHHTKSPKYHKYLDHTKTS